MYNSCKKRGKGQDGYTLLFAVLVAAIVLSIGISILSITKKQFLLASGARNSTASLYAADSGMECADYNDQPQNGDVFSTTTNNLSHLRCGPTNPVVITSSNVDGTTGIGTTVFSIDFGQAATTCTTITVIKEYVQGNPTTVIDSRGYNLGWDSANSTCDIASANKVERALQLSY